ncbi:hypothetical protein J2T17_004624 [Paenibacillus mucilaginosus]|uniref:hypothetical protein n=1 Tax=Paenibacillus mucilaginosus TaxID=61624 RepID=UPI003D232FE7
MRDYIGDEVLTVIFDQIKEVTRRMQNVMMAGRTISLGIGYSQDEGGGGLAAHVRSM